MNTAMIRTLFITAIATFSAACGKSDASSSGPASGTNAAPAGSTAPASAPGKAGIVATCVKGTTSCVEYRNNLPDYVEEMCKAGPDYVFRKGSTPCPTEKLLGTCFSKAAPDETNYWYGNSPEEADVAKGVCDVVGQWTPAGKASATATAAAAPPKAPAAPAGATPSKKKK